MLIFLTARYATLTWARRAYQSAKPVDFTFHTASAAQTVLWFSCAPGEITPIKFLKIGSTVLRLSCISLCFSLLLNIGLTAFVVFSEFVYHDVVFPQRSVLEKLNINGFKYIKVAYASSLATTATFPALFRFVPVPVLFCLSGLFH